MTTRTLRVAVFSLFGLGVLVGCGFDNTLREYLDVRFWLPLSKRPEQFERENVKRADVPYSGMTRASQDTSLGRLRNEYQKISTPQAERFDEAVLRTAVASARSDQTLSLREREEVDLIDAKIDMRAGQADDTAPLIRARQKFEDIISRAQTPEWVSEARGWLAYTHYLLGNRVAAGKIYLDELNRDGSNLNRETLLSSLQMTFGYDGGNVLSDHLEEFFDTPEHAVFAIQMITNPVWDRNRLDSLPSQTLNAPVYTRLKSVLAQHAELLRDGRNSNALPLLSMRLALRMGDPEEALKVARRVPAGSRTLREPDFLWMLAAARFVSRDYENAEEPLLALFGSSRATRDQKSAAAYGLCGIYQKINQPVEQIRYALWLRTSRSPGQYKLSYFSSIEDQTVYWADSGWDLGLLLDAEAPLSALEGFIEKYSKASDIRLVQYSLAVRLARMDEYERASDVYSSIGAARRAERMKRVAELFRRANDGSTTAAERHEAQYEFAEYLSANSDRIYFNAELWSGLQNYALNADSDSRLTGEEHKRLSEGERKLRDDQEERWRAYRILHGIVREEGHTELGRKAAQLALRNLRKISQRFGRFEEIRKADIELSNWLQVSTP
jgi:hypothetical protein